MKAIGAGAFKTHCLALLDQVQETGEPILVTKRGKPVARVSPVETQKPESIFGFLRGKAKIVGNVMESTMTDEQVAQWERNWDDLTR